MRCGKQKKAFNPNEHADRGCWVEHLCSLRSVASPLKLLTTDLRWSLEICNAILVPCLNLLVFESRCKCNRLKYEVIMKEVAIENIAIKPINFNIILNNRWRTVIVQCTI